MVFRDFLEPKASLEKFLEPFLELQGETVDLEYVGTKASPALQEFLEVLVCLLFV